MRRWRGNGRGHEQPKPEAPAGHPDHEEPAAANAEEPTAPAAKDPSAPGSEELTAPDAEEPAEPDRTGAPDETAAETGLAEAEATAAALEALRSERDELQGALLRRRAEFDNYRKRVERDQGVASADASAEVLRRLVGTVDNLERALASAGGEDALRTGVELTLRDFLSALEGLGVTVVDPLGQRFDPALHQALAHERVPGVGEGTVAEVFRKGYTFKDRLLRPALVKVASGQGTDEGEEGETGDAGAGTEAS